MKNKGFTIVELLIVIVVIGILAAIVIVAYNGVQTRAQNTQRINELSTWKRAFESYKAREGQYPAVPAGSYCLGVGFLIGNGGQPRCRDYQISGSTSYPESDNTTLMSEFSKIIKIPKPSNIPANGTLGPYAEYTSTIILLYTWIKGGGSSCPTDVTAQGWDDGTGNRTACTITLTR